MRTMNVQRQQDGLCDRDAETLAVLKFTTPGEGSGNDGLIPAMNYPAAGLHPLPRRVEFLPAPLRSPIAPLVRPHMRVHWHRRSRRPPPKRLLAQVVRVLTARERHFASRCRHAR